MLDNKTELHPEHSHETWLGLQPARHKLKEHISQFLTSNVGWKKIDDSEHPPVLGLKVSAGLGKTRTALECIAQHGHDFLENGHILFYVPTLDLAVEAERTFKDLKSDHPSFVMRGRSALNPETRAPMCERADLAKKVAKSAKSVTRAICREDNPNGESFEAACAKGCPYLAQEKTEKNHVVFLAHSYLKSKPPLAGNVALRIIDEKFWKEMIDLQTLPHDAWLFAPDHLKARNLSGAYEKMQSAVTSALKAKTPVHLALRGSDITSETLRDLANAEKMALPTLELDLRSPDDIVRMKVDTFDHAAANSIRVRSLICDLLAKTIDHRGTERLSLAKPSEQSDHRALVKLHQVADLPDDAPTILLDADLDETIVRRFCNNAQFERLLVRPKAHVIQVSDRTLASSTLKTEGRQKQRADVATIIKREVERAQSNDVLVVASTAVLHALYKYDGKVFEETSAKPQKLYGATVRRFGSKLLGINTYSDYATIILVGRLQLPVVTIEDQLRAVFGDSDVPLDLTEDEKLVASKTSILRADNKRVEAKFQSHPDPRGASLLQQGREAQSEQAIARLRLLDANIPKRVLVLSNVPLPGLTVDEWIRFDALVQEKTNVQVSKKYQKLEHAIREDNGHKPKGLRLSAAGLFGDADKVFPTLKLAKEFRKKLRTPDVLDWTMAIAAEMGMSATHVQLSKGKRGGHSTPAIVFTNAADAQQRSRELWPDYDKYVVIEGSGIAGDDDTAVVEAI